MAACRYTCEGCNRAVPRAMWEDDQCWATDSSEFYCYDCWEEWTTKQGGKQGSVCRSSTGSALASTFASTSTFASAFASAPAYNRMDVDEYEDEDEDMFRCVETGVAGKVRPRPGCSCVVWSKKKCARPLGLANCQLPRPGLGM
jgi:hypothetical protein